MSNPEKIGRQGRILDSKDVQMIIAEYFGVPVKNVVKSQYTYSVIEENSEEKED